jgi:hypothetical protein
MFSHMRVKRILLACILNVLSLIEMSLTRVHKMEPLEHDCKIYVTKLT